MNDPHNSQTLHDRLQLAAGDLSYRQLGTLTGTHPETVRRYMQGHSPSASFLCELSEKLGISGEWLLSGRLPMKVEDIPSHVLEHADPNVLVHAVAGVVLDVLNRLDQGEKIATGSSAHNFRLAESA